MTVDHHELYVATRDSQEVQGSVLRRWLREFAFHDWIVLAYLLTLNLAVLSAPAGASRTAQLSNVVGLLVIQLVILVLVRGRLLRHPFAAPLLYRMSTYGCVQISYFLFADLLPLVNPRVLDQDLYALDLSLFGVEPAMFFDRLVTPTTTEWFAFFYFGYFFVLALHVIPMLLLSRRTTLLGEFALGLLVVFCVGHTVYMLVPGYGPYKAMPELFQNELPAGLWWNMTTEIVATGGAQKDIFPSLHTAAPTFLLLFSFRHRRKLPFRYTWPILAFFTANIILATMFLRWHYVIDVLAGLGLALGAYSLSVRVPRSEAVRRQREGLTQAWPQWFQPISEARPAPARPAAIGDSRATAERPWDH